MLDYNDLQFFAFVVAEGGFSSAARMLGVPKSRISRRITLLEHRLGVRLLERSTRHLALTEAGRLAYEHARAIVMEAHAIEEVAIRLQSEPTGLVRVSCPPGLETTISGALPAFLEAHPKIRLVCMVTNRPVDLVQEGIDVAIRIRERLDTDPDLQMRRVGISRRILVASQEFILKHGNPSDLEALSALPLLSPYERVDASSWTLTRTDGLSRVVKFEPRLATGSFAFLLGAARASLGVALVPEAGCLEDLQDGKLVRFLPEWTGTDGVLHLLFTSRRGMLPSVRAVIDFLANTLKDADV